MDKLKIPQNHTGISKTLRIPENIVEDIEVLSKVKNTSFNQISICLMKFGLDNLEQADKDEIKRLKNGGKNE